MLFFCSLQTVLKCDVTYTVYFSTKIVVYNVSSKLPVILIILMRTNILIYDCIRLYPTDINISSKSINLLLYYLTHFCYFLRQMVNLLTSCSMVHIYLSHCHALTILGACQNIFAHVTNPYTWTSQQHTFKQFGSNFHFILPQDDISNFPLLYQTILMQKNPFLFPNKW